MKEVSKKGFLHDDLIEVIDASWVLRNTMCLN